MFKIKICKIILCLTLLVTFFLPNPVYAESESENLYKIGNSYYNKRDFVLAISNYTKAIELNPQYDCAYCNRGDCYSKKYISYNLAIADYTKAIELNHQDTDYYIKRAETYRDQARHDLAMDDYNQVLKMKPNDNDAFMKKYNLLKYAGCELYDYYDSDLRDTSYNPFRKK